MARRRLGKRFRKNPESYSSNPPVFTDIAEFVLPGFAAFAASRLLTRIATTQISTRWPQYAKHAGAIAAIGTAAAAWFGAHRVKYLEQYQTPIVVGSAIAGIQSLIQLYIPGLGWMVSDASPELAETTGAISQIDSIAASGAKVTFLNDDPNEFTYNDSFDPGVTTTAKSAAAKHDEEVGGDLSVAVEDDDFSNMDLGSLGNAAA